MEGGGKEEYIMRTVQGSRNTDAELQTNKQTCEKASDASTTFLLNFFLFPQGVTPVLRRTSAFPLERNSMYTCAHHFPPKIVFPWNMSASHV